MKGAKPKATVLKLVTGNPGRRPLNKQEAKPEVAIPEPPELLERDEHALAEWRRVTPLLADVGLITNLDRAVVAGYCMAWSRWLECERQLKVTGLIVKSPNAIRCIRPISRRRTRHWIRCVKCRNNSACRVRRGRGSGPGTPRAITIPPKIS